MMHETNVLIAFQLMIMFVVCLGICGVAALGIYLTSRPIFIWSLLFLVFPCAISINDYSKINEDDFHD